MSTLRPGKEAGEYVIPALGKTIKLVEWREDDYFDTVQAPNAVTAGTMLEYFRDLQQKNLQHTNLKTPRRIPAGAEFIMQRVGILIDQAVGAGLVTALDTITSAYSASLTFKINERLITEGPLFKYQSGYGMTGFTTVDATSIITTGVASAAAAPQLLVQQTVNDQADLVGQVYFYDNAWLNGGSSMPTFTTKPCYHLMLHGLIKKPSGQ